MIGAACPLHEISRLDAGEEGSVDDHVLLLSDLGGDSEGVPLEQKAQVLSVDKVDRGSPVPGGLLLGLAGESAGGDEQALVSSPGHRATEVADLLRSDAALVALALEEDLKGDQRQAVDADAVDPAFTRAAGDGHGDEVGLAEQALSQSFERVGGHREQGVQEGVGPVGGLVLPGLVGLVRRAGGLALGFGRVGAGDVGVTEAGHVGVDGRLALGGEVPQAAAIGLGQSHALEVGARPGEAVLDLGLGAVAVQDGLLIHGEAPVADDPPCDLHDAPGPAEVAQGDDGRPQQFEVGRDVLGSVVPSHCIPLNPIAPTCAACLRLTPADARG